MMYARYNYMYVVQTAGRNAISDNMYRYASEKFCFRFEVPFF